MPSRQYQQFSEQQGLVPGEDRNHIIDIAADNVLNASTTVPSAPTIARRRRVIDYTSELATINNKVTIINGGSYLLFMSLLATLTAFVIFYRVMGKHTLEPFEIVTLVILVVALLLVLGFIKYVITPFGGMLASRVLAILILNDNIRLRVDNDTGRIELINIDPHTANIAV